MSLLSVKLSIKTYMDFLMKTDNHLQTINIVVLKSDIPTAPFTFIVWFQGAKDDYQKCCWILSCIHQMRECFSWIVVTSQTLSESEPCWYAIDNGPDYEVLFHALTRIWKSSVQPYVSWNIHKFPQKYKFHVYMKKLKFFILIEHLNHLVDE